MEEHFPKNFAPRKRQSKICQFTVVKNYPLQPVNILHFLIGDVNINLLLMKIQRSVLWHLRDHQ